MNDQHGFWWDILETASRVIGAALAFGFGWLARKFAQIDKRMTTMEQEFTARNHASETQIVRLQVYHESNIQRLDSIEENTKAINDKLDRLFQSLSNRRDHRER